MNKFQPSFSAGEFAPSLHSRTDINKYASGLSTCRNFIPQLEGGVSRRTGTKYINTTKNQGESVILVPFQVSNDEGYQIEFGDGYCRFYKDKGLINFDIDDYSIFDPTANYAVDDLITIYDCLTVEMDSAKKLYFHGADGISYPNSGTFVGGIAIAVTQSSSDNLVVYTVTNALWIELAMTTPSKNTAALIQAAIVADGTYPNIIVTENSEYEADRLVTTTYSVANYKNTINATFKVTAPITGNSNHTSNFPILSSSVDEYYEGINPHFNEYYSINEDYFIFQGKNTELTTPYSSNDLASLDFRQSADVLFITHPDYQPYQLIRNGEYNWDFQKYNYLPPPFRLSNSDIAHTMTLGNVFGSTTLTSSVPFFNDQQVGSYFKVYHDVAGQSVKQTFAATGVTTSIKCKGTWRIRSFGATCDLEVNVEKSLDNGTTWTVLRTFSIVNTEIDTFGEIEEYALIRLNCTSFTAGNTVSLTTDPFSHAGICKISYLSVLNPDTVASVNIVDIFSSTGASVDWAESAWSDYRGFPSALTFFQDRLCFANTHTDPQTIWMSQTGDYYNFDVSDNFLGTDSISVQLASRQLNGINNLVFLDNIIALTYADEWRVGASDDGAITPTNIAAKVQGNRGSANIQPVQIGNKIIYPQPSGTIIRDLGYDYNSNSFTGDNISVLSNHLFKGHTIVDMAYAEEPNSNVYFVRDDGVLIIMTYMKEQEIVGFSKHDTNGTFENVSVIKSDNKNEVWVVVKRGDDRFIEVFEETQTDVEDQWYLDSALSYSGVATTILTGLDHLEGYSVDVLLNGNVVTDLTVSSGEITLPMETTNAIVGLRYISDFESLPLTFQFESGTSKDKKIRSHQCTFIFENTRGGWVGDPSIGTITESTHENTLNESVQKRTFMDEPIDLFSGQISFNLNSGWGLDRKIFYRQYDPLPANILAIIPSVKIGG